MTNRSNVEVVLELQENVYWQVFCWMESFDTGKKLDASSLTKIRQAFKRLGKKGKETKKEEQYIRHKIYAKLYRYDVDQQLSMLEQMVAIDDTTPWAGWAKLEKAKILIAEAKEAGILQNNFFDIENLILSVIYDYGDLFEPVSGLIEFPRGLVPPGEGVFLANLLEKIPVQLKHSARLELAKLYTEVNKNNEARAQLDILLVMVRWKN